MEKEELEELSSLLSKISTISLEEESEKLGVDIVDMVNKNFEELLLKIDKNENDK